ncbi:DUF676 domain-containing protein [Aphelenchoides fujianensis]|nr:DUF676 domain-containing protein [Aphelenchoides fujianensis]
MRVEAYPRFSLQITLDAFHAIELVHGYYQIRFRLKQNFPITSRLKCEPKPNSSPRSRAAVHFETGVSRPIKVAFGEQTVDLLDVFHATVDVHKRFDRMVSSEVEIQLELWYLDPENLPRPENYTFISKRVVAVLLRPDRSTHYHRPVFFEYFCFSAVSLTIHACLTEMVMNRTKSIPDPPLNEKLCNYHRTVCTRLLGFRLAMQSFIKTYSHLLTSPLKINCVDIEREVGELQSALASSQQPWTLFQEQIRSLCSQLSQLFSQFVQLFDCNRSLSFVLLDEFDAQRMKRFAEGFLFVEDTVKSLLLPEQNINTRIFELIKKSGYLGKLPSIPVRVDGTDVEGASVCLILEHRYLPTGATVFSPADTTSGESNAQRIPTISTDCATASPPPERTAESTSSTQRSPSSERLKFVASMCFPLNRTPRDDESYGASDKSDHLLSPTSQDRWGRRRMTDPCCAGVPVEEVEKTALLPSPNDRCSPNATHKSKSFSNIAGHAEETAENTAASTSGSSSTGSLLRTAESISPSKKNEAAVVVSPPNDKVLLRLVDQDRIVLVEQRELLKQRLAAAGYRGYFYSDQASFLNRRPYFSAAFNEAVERRICGKLHLVVFVHGLEGTSEDLSAYRNCLRIALPETNFAFLLSEVNQNETWTDLQKMAENLLAEILRFIDRMPQKPHRISLIAHSLGGLIVRAMCGLEKMKPLFPLLWTFLSLNSPHLGLTYLQRTANFGISFLKWWKRSVCIEQLLLKDNIDIHETFLYKLSQNGAFGLFSHVLLVGSQDDLYVPSHSALIETSCKAAADPSAQSACYYDMLTHLNESIVSSQRHTTLVKYTVLHSLSNMSRAQQLSGRAIHIAVVDDDNFIEKFLTVSASKYFQSFIE